MARATSLGARTVSAVAVALLVAYAVVVVLVTTVPRVGISPDSTSYVAAARALAASGRLTDWDGQPLSLFAPGLSVLLGLLLRAGLTVDPAVTVVNEVSVAGLVVVSWRLARTTTGSVLGSVLVAAAVATSAAVAVVHGYAWSEPPFTVLVALAVWWAARTVRRERVGVVDVVVIGSAVSLATTMRYAGIFLLPLVLIATLLVPADSLGRRVGRALAVTGTSSLGLVAVVARNLVHGVAPLGERIDAGRPAAEVGRQTLLALGDLVAPAVEGPGAERLGTVLLAVLAVGASLALARRDRVMVVVVLAVAGYAALLGWAQLTTPVDALGPRMLVPILAPLLTLAAYPFVVVARTVATKRPRRPGALSTVVAAVVSAVLVALAVLVPVASATTNVSTGWTAARAVSGRGQALSLNDLDSPLAAAITPSVCAAGVAATSPWRAYWVTGCRPITPVPRTSRPVPHLGTVADLRAAVQQGRVRYLALWRGSGWAGPADLSGLGCTFTRVGRYADGTLWRVDC